MKSVFAVALLAATVAAGLGANDWAKPCFHGECAWDIPAAEGYQGSGSLKIWGHRNAIADITPAAGWVILDCDPHRFSQDIRIVCDNAEASGCSHFFEGGGPEHKIVRLPDTCGGAPFARISQVALSHDQSIPSSAQYQISRRDGSLPQVYTITIDSEWNQIDYTKFGIVNFAVLASTVPGMNTTFDGTHSLLERRGSDAFIENAIERFSSSTNDSPFVFKKNEKETSIDLSDISGKSHLNTPHTLFEKKLSCGSIAEAGVSIKVTPKLTGKLRVGIVGKGSLGGPGGSKFSDFQGYTKLDADFVAHLEAALKLKGTLSSGDINIVPDVAIPGLGLTVPNIITFGAHVLVTGKASVTVELGTKFDAEVGFSIKGAELYFPWKDSRTGTADIKDADLKWMADPTIFELSMSAEASVTPQVRLGVTLFGGKAPSSYVSVGIEGKVSTKAQSAIHGPNNNPKLQEYNQLTKKIKNIGGCSKINAGLDVYLGIDHPILNFVTSTPLKKSLWQKEWDLYKNCWGFDNKKKRHSTISRIMPRSSLDSANTDPFCPDKNWPNKPLQAWADHVRASAAKLLKG